ncbi:hypothetical protein SAMN05443637_105140 [Pseudonocardia thermophila]|jgi:hypothetical protein|uniref:Uncharacterized protein n=1 Tax=Pseudonocardia thermophila TaxID=1848 RepID=A0A1M6RSR0_PSETH|nr:hypothetical protein [Pseudonocardia thermophila]SHK35541.1 hypothetical protein SAMN05443637_105140 [Pseudonocardia thermophila]
MAWWWIVGGAAWFVAAAVVAVVIGRAVAQRDKQVPRSGDEGPSVPRTRHVPVDDEAPPSGTRMRLRLGRRR